MLSNVNKLYVVFLGIWGFKTSNLTSWEPCKPFINHYQLFLFPVFSWAYELSKSSGGNYTFHSPFKPCKAKQIDRLRSLLIRLDSLVPPVPHTTQLQKIPDKALIPFSFLTKKKTSAFQVPSKKLLSFDLKWPSYLLIALWNQDFCVFTFQALTIFKKKSLDGFVFKVTALPSVFKGKHSLYFCI